MPPHRTRKPAQGFAAGLALLALACACPLSAAEPDVRIESTSFGTAAASRPQIRILGHAAPDCAPSVQRTTFDGVDVSIELHAPKTGCGSGSAPYTLRVDPAVTGTSMAAGRIYRVSVFLDTADPALVAFRVFDTGASGGSGPQPENGFWWSEASPDAGPASRSTGINLELQGDQLAVSLFGFNDAGSPTWYFGSGRQHGSVATVPLLELRNGDPLFSPTGSRPSATGGLRLEMEFLSPVRARAWLVREEEGRDVAVRALALSRSRFSADVGGADWNGRWVLVGDDDATLSQFDFSGSVRQDADSFHLADVAGASLDCRRNRATALPDLCTLSVGAATLADFNQIGFDRLDGYDGSGARVRLQRVSRP